MSIGKLGYNWNLCMSDEADRANDTAETFLAAALRNRKLEAPQHGVGMCLNCGAAVPGDRRWCDAECAAEWERHASR
jgi:hypothetical protein